MAAAAAAGSLPLGRQQVCRMIAGFETNGHTIVMLKESVSTMFALFVVSFPPGPRQRNIGPLLIQ